ncbi:MAG: chromosomal replication initiator protein DnaA [Rhodobacteraceae bacterium HLUCCA08]|nr:MAG: chromosomal replication initiator protein DnaA [Rhodobacteraceae bacterium HLUCCA08]
MGTGIADPRHLCTVPTVGSGPDQGLGFVRRTGLSSAPPDLVEAASLLMHQDVRFVRDEWYRPEQRRTTVGQKDQGAEAQMTTEEWRSVKAGIRDSVGANNFRNWIEPLELQGLQDGVALFDAPNSFHGTYVRKTFGELIIYHLNAGGAKVQRLDFEVGKSVNGTAAPAPQPAVAPAPQPPVASRDDIGSPIDARFTFDNFVVGKPNELAHAAARRVAESEHVTFNPLFLYGGVGLGKTHLMHAIAHELKRTRPEAKVLYIRADEFIMRFVSAIRDKSMMDFKQLFRSADVLMIDDIQFFAGKDGTQEEFFHTFNALVDQNKQLVLTADRAPGEIKDLSERIKSRCQCGLVVDLHPTDYELRLSILQAKRGLHEALYPGVVLRDGVLEFLAHRISTNVRVLEGALMRLFAFASLVGREVTLEMAQECLADILRASDRKITIDEIQRKVSEHYAIRLSDLVGPRRLRSYARPRQVAMWLCKQMTNKSLPEIGRKFGKRDHTTIMHGVRKIEELRKTDSSIDEDLELLRRALED